MQNDKKVSEKVKKKGKDLLGECMSISEQELKTFIKEDNQMQNEGIGYINETNVDSQGMTTKMLSKNIIVFLWKKSL